MTKDRHPPKNDSRDAGIKDNSAKPKNHRRRYSDYFDFAPVGYFTLDRDSVIQNVNPAGALLLGADRDQLVNQPFAAVIASESRDVFESHSRQVFKSPEKQTCDLKLLNGGGHSRESCCHR